MFVHAESHVEDDLQRSIASLPSLPPALAPLVALCQRARLTAQSPSNSTSSPTQTRTRSLMSASELERFAAIVDPQCCVRAGLERVRLGADVALVDMSSAAPDCHQLAAPLCDCCQVTLSRRELTASSAPPSFTTNVRVLAEIAPLWSNRSEALRNHQQFLAPFVAAAMRQATYCASCNANDHVQVTAMINAIFFCVQFEF